MHELSVRECLSFGWNTYKARPWLFVASSLIIFGLSIASDLPRVLVEDLPGTSGAVLVFIAGVIGVLLSFLITMGKTAFYLHAHDSVSTVHFKDLWHSRHYLKFVATSVIAGGLTVLGLLLLIVPGIIVGIMFGFALYLVIDKDRGVIESLKESAALTKGNRWKMFGLGLAILGINILGLLALVIGLLVTLPVSTLAVIHAYRTLSHYHSTEIVSAA